MIVTVINFFQSSLGRNSPIFGNRNIPIFERKKGHFE
jgi:hypothetical protein